MGEKRVVYARIIVDDSKAIAEDLGTLDYFQREAGRMRESGIEVDECLIADIDSTSSRERSIRLALDWAFEHYGDEE